MRRRKPRKLAKSQPKPETRIESPEDFDYEQSEVKGARSRGQRRKHLDERLKSLQQRQVVIESQLKRLEGRFYRVCIFGSARIKAKTKAYEDVSELARYLAWDGIDVLTGGGPGLMEAANAGALLGQREKKSKAKSFGISVELPFEPVPNPHLDIKRHHQRFSSRLDDFMRLSNAVVITPGGIGTVLELFFTWQLLQVKHLTPRPIILMDSKFWQGMLDWLRTVPLSARLLNADDMERLTVVDTPKQVYEAIKVDYAEFLKQKPSLEALSHKVS